MNIEELRKFCIELPGVTEDVKWGNDLCFSVGKKMFTVTGVNDAEGGISVKTTPEKFGELTERPGIRPAHYVARYHWITVEDPASVTDEELRQLIRESYQLVFDKLPAKIKKTIP
ncbi:MmcQ/YjbR family DNA-binding protein [soil metagenome]